MHLEGTVHNGVIVFDQPTVLPEGTRVSVIVQNESEPKSNGRERLLALAGKIDDLPPDMSKNIDHYLYGAPKQ